MRVSTLNGLLLAVPLATAFAQTKDLQMNVVYECPAVQSSIKVYSCEGPAANNWCDVQSFSPVRPGQRGKSTRQQVMGLLQICHAQTPAEAQAATRPGNGAPGVGAAAMAGPGGLRVGDNVRVLINGWNDAKVLGVNGQFYRVRLSNGLEVSKMWPYEVHRAGKLTAEDHAAGQYDVDDRVQVLVNGKWMEGNVRGQNNNMYDVKVPGVDTGFGSDIVNTTAQNIRMSNTPAPPPPTKRSAGQAPKPGLTSCSAKFDGRWEMQAGALRVVLRGGKATVTEPLAPAATYDCFMGEGEMRLYSPGEFKPADLFTLLPNNDGTLQTEMGALKKMGN